MQILFVSVSEIFIFLAQLTTKIKTMLKNIFSFLLLSAVLISSCQKDESDDNNNNTTTSSTTSSTTSTTSSSSGSYYIKYTYDSTNYNFTTEVLGCLVGNYSASVRMGIEGDTYSGADIELNRQDGLTNLDVEGLQGKTLKFYPENSTDVYASFTIVSSGSSNTQSADYQNGTFKITNLKKLSETSLVVSYELEGTFSCNMSGYDDDYVTNGIYKVKICVMKNY